MLRLGCGDAVRLPGRQALRVLKRLVQPVNGIVVREGEGRQPFFTGVIHQLCGGEASIGTVGMYV